MTKTTLDQLSQAVDDKQILGNPKIQITDITNDSRQAKPGTLFVAISGHNDDGHKYIRQAVEQGAVAVVAEKTTPGLPVPQLLTGNARLAQARLACAFFGHPSRNMRVIGVTGTNGKTTTTLMIDSMLRAAGHVTGLMGTLYCKIGDKILPTANTTPDSITCQRWLRQMADAGIRYVTMEVSSHGTVMHRVDGINFSAGAITNFSIDHLDLHRTMAEYRRAKQRFFNMLSHQAMAVACQDDPDAMDIVRGSAARLWTWSQQKPADVMLTKHRQAGSQTLLTLAVNRYHATGSPLQRQLVLPLAQEHNISNAMLAIATCLALGTDITAIEEGLASFPGVFRRYETIYDGQFKVVDDASHNPANLDAVFRTAAREDVTGITVVYAIRGSRGLEINRAIARTIAHWHKELRPDTLVITSCTDTAGPTDQVKPEEYHCFVNELLRHKVNFIFRPRLWDAVEEGLMRVRPGGLLLLLGAHPMDDVSHIFSEISGLRVQILPRPPRFGQPLDSHWHKV